MATRWIAAVSPLVATSWTWQLWHCVVRSASLLLSWMGTTGLAVIVAIIVSVGPTAVNFVRRRPKGQATVHLLWETFRKSLKVGVTITVVIWIMLFVGATVVTIYRDHNDLVSVNNELRSQLKSLRGVQNQAAVELRDKIRHLLDSGEVVRAAYEREAFTSNRQAREKDINDWRTMTGDVLNAPPLRNSGAKEYVLTLSGDLITEPLQKLREVFSSLDRWMEHDLPVRPRSGAPSSGAPTAAVTPAPTTQMEAMVGFVIRYQGAVLDRQVITLARPIDPTKRQVQMFIDPNISGAFTITGISVRNESSTILEADSVYLSVLASVKKWQENRAGWELSPDRNIEGWTTFRSFFGHNSIRPGHPLEIQDFIGTPVPTEPTKVRITIVYGLKEEIAEFTIRGGVPLDVENREGRPSGS